MRSLTCTLEPIIETTPHANCKSYGWHFSSLLLLYLTLALAEHMPVKYPSVIEVKKVTIKSEDSFEPLKKAPAPVPGPL